MTTQNRFMAAGFLTLVPAVAMAASFTFTTLDVPGQRLTTLGAGTSLNDSDQVVGTTQAADFSYQGFSWQNGSFTLYQTCTQLNSVNAGSLAVGYTAGNAAQYCTVALPNGATRLYPFTEPGTIRLLGLNAAGTVLAEDTSRSDKTSGLVAVRKRMTRFAVVTPTKYGGTFPTGITASGTIVGDYTPAGASWNQGFVYADGSYTVFNVPGALGTYPSFIDADGTLGGEYVSSGSAHPGIGFVRSGSAYTTVLPPGASTSFVVGIGPGGAVVGSWEDANGISHGFIYLNGSYSQIDVPGAARTKVLGVNARGSLVGTFTDQSGTDHPFIAQCAAGGCTQ